MSYSFNSRRQRDAWLRKRRIDGFSLVELMVAVVLGLFLVIGLISLIVSNTRTRAELDKSSQQIENGRFALQLLSEDIQHAGFTGTTLTRTAGSIVQVAPSPCPATVAALQYAAAPNYAASVPFSVSFTAPTSSFATSTAALAAYPCINDGGPGVTHYMPNTAVVVVTRVSTSTTPVASAISAEAYLQGVTCATDTTPFSIDVGSAGSAGFTRTETDCATSASLRKVMQRVYFVSSCDVCSPSDNLPTLKMAEYVNGAMQITPLVEGIQDLQVEYGIDMDNNGSPDCYTSNPASPPAAEVAVAVCPQTTPAYNWTNAAANWSNVVTVRVVLLARNNDTSGGWTDTRTYAMGLAEGSVGPFNDRYKRHVYSTVVRLYNISGQRELQ
jgi:type IV pilus assembly protein PilW